MKKNTNRRPLAAASSFTTFHRVSDRSFLFISSQLDIVNGFFSPFFFVVSSSRFESDFLNQSVSEARLLYESKSEKIPIFALPDY